MAESYGPYTFLAFLAAMIVAVLALYAWQHRRADLRPVARKTLLELMSEGMLVLDAQNRVVDLNPAAAGILGVPVKGTIGCDAASVLGQLPRLIELVRAPAAQAEIAVGTGAAGTCYDVSASALTNERGWQMGKLVVFYDITEQQQLQAQLLEKQRTLAMLEERERLTHEFHDSLGAALSSVNGYAQQARELLSQDSQAASDALARLTAIAQDAHADVREYLLGVKTASAFEHGFFSALRQYLEQFGETYGIHVEWDVPAELSDLSDCAIELPAQVQLLRIIQEALTNVRKYAHAHHVRVSFAVLGDRARVVIQDDGMGFEPAQRSDAEGKFGLHFMRERAEEAGGSLEIHSASGQGTQVMVQVPLSGGRSQNKAEAAVRSERMSPMK